MTRNVYEELAGVTENGVYLVRDVGVINYGDKWAFGYAVPLRELRTSDVKRSTLFTVNDGAFAFANHVDAIRDARQVARGAGAEWMYGLWEQEWVKV